MSSFVISRTDYAKAAGFIAGIASAKYCGSPALFLYDYSRGRRYTAADFFPAFEWLYNLNLKSVCLQYEDSPEEWEEPADVENVRAVFNEWRTKTETAYYMKPAQVVHGIAEFKRFCASILYQIEDPECERLAKGFVYRLCFALNDVTERLSGQELESWGAFEIDL